MLETIHIGVGRPVSYTVDPNAIFQPGMLAQMKVIGNDTVIGVSDGTAPIGIIDDVKDQSFSKPVVDEVVVILAPSVTYDGYEYRMGADTMQSLNNASVIDSSFVSEYEDSDGNELSLNPVNGVVIASEGSILNYKANGSATPNAIRTEVNYSYSIPGIPGEDSTLGSNRVTLWFTRGIYATDQFEPGAKYAVNSVLYASENGKFTTKKTMSSQPAIAQCLVPPTAHNAMLQLMWI